MTNSSTGNASGKKGGASPSTPNRPRNDETPRPSVPGNATPPTPPMGSNTLHGSSSRPGRPSPGSSRGPSGGGMDRGLGQAVPVGGGNASGGVGSPGNVGSPAGRKRGRVGEESLAGGSNEPVNPYRLRDYHCSLCNTPFGSPKALFGHLRSHPDRGWKGAHPPPTFKADEEFADIRAAEAGAAAEEAPVEEPRAPEGNFRVPDLNKSPPPDSQ